MKDYTNEQKAVAIKRELRYRRYVYPKRVASNQMMQEHADREIDVFESILSDYERLAEKERLL